MKDIIFNLDHSCSKLSEQVVQFLDHLHFKKEVLLVAIDFIQELRFFYRKVKYTLHQNEFIFSSS